MRIAHVTEAPSTGAPLFKQAEETQITIKNIDLHRRCLKVDRTFGLIRNPLAK